MVMRSIRTRLLLILLPIFFLFFGLLSGIGYYLAYRIVKENISETASAINADYANQIKANIQAKMIHLRHLAETKRIKSGEPDQIMEVLGDMQKLEPTLETIVYIDVNGKGIRYDGSTGEFRDRIYFAKVFETKEPYISEPLISRGQKKPSVILVMPVINDGRLQAMLAVAYTLNKLTETVEPLHFQETGHGFVINEDGLIIAHPEYPNLVGKIKLGERLDPALSLTITELDTNLVDLFHAALDRDTQVIGKYKFLDGIPRYAVFTPIRLPGGVRWIMGVSAPEAEVNRELNLLTRLMIVASITGIAIGTFIIVKLSDYFVIPIRKLRDECLFLTQGNLEERDLQIHCNDEIGQLSDGFCVMLSKLRTMLRELENNNQLLEEEIQMREQAQQELEHAHESLEEKVQEKTSELSAANQSLTAMNEEMTAMNETLNEANSQLQDEIQTRHEAEKNLLTRERQYRAITSLLTRPANEIDDLLDTILKSALQLIKTPDGVIAMRDDADRCIVKEGSGISKCWENNPFPGMIYQEVLRTGEMVYIEDYRHHPKRDQESQFIQMTSIIMLPLKSDEHVIGIISASWQDEVHVLTDDEQAIMQQFADLASVALERVNSFTKVRYTAYHDNLTGLPNRAYLAERLDAEMEQARQHEAAGAVFFVDLDDLKTVNDSLGHRYGDAIIIQSGAIIVKEAGHGSFVARIGGDEFIVILPGKTTKEEAAIVADRIIKALTYEQVVLNVNIQMTASIGVVIYPIDGNTSEEILKNADNAMYAAKKAGKNCWRYFEPSMQAETYKKMVLTGNLRGALNRKEMRLVYQPQVKMSDMSVNCFEALLRWDSPQHGAVSPTSFIPLAEESGLIHDIGKWVLQQACLFGRRLADNGRKDIRISVNVSPSQLSDELFVKIVYAALTDAGISPGQLEIEITETALMSSLENTAYNLNALHALGVRLALDDFGTGYSSLTYLHRLPVDTLKIDKSFIDMTLTNSTKTSIIGNIIDMAHGMGMTVVAEGAETKMQVDFLVKNRCDYIQGYYFSKPIPENDALFFKPLA